MKLLSKCFLFFSIRMIFWIFIKKYFKKNACVLLVMWINCAVKYNFIQLWQGKEPYIWIQLPWHPHKNIINHMRWLHSKWIQVKLSGEMHCGMHCLLSVFLTILITYTIENMHWKLRNIFFAFCIHPGSKNSQRHWQMHCSDLLVRVILNLQYCQAVSRRIWMSFEFCYQTKAKWTCWINLEGRNFDIYFTSFFKGEKC